MSVRRLGPGDLAAMRAVNALFGEVFEDRHAYEGLPPDDAYLLRLLGRDEFVALGAYDGERPVGALCAYRLDKFEQNRSEYYIYDLAVRTEWRRRGIATMLIRSLGGIARDEGAYVLFVQADQGDDPAIALYSKLGRREEVLHFDIDPTG